MRLVRSQLGSGLPVESSAELWKQSKRHSFDPAMSPIINLNKHDRFAALHSRDTRSKHIGRNNLTVVKMSSINGEHFCRELCIADTLVYGYMWFRNISCQTCSSLLPRALLSHSFSMRFWGRVFIGVYYSILSSCFHASCASVRCR